MFFFYFSSSRNYQNNTARVGLKVKSTCFLLRGHKFKTRGGKSTYAFVDLQSNRSMEVGLMSHKQGGFIHQFGIWLGRDLKIG